MIENRMNLFNQLIAMTEKYTDKIAIKPANITYKELAESVSDRAREFSFRLNAGTPVYLDKDDTVNFIINFYALNSLSIPVLPGNNDIKDEEIYKYVSCRINSDGHITSLGDAQPVDTRVALILFTSGTTGSPKPVYFTNTNLLSNCLTVSNSYFKFENDACGLLTSSLCYILGLNMQMNMMLLTGNTLYVPKAVDFDNYVNILREGEINYISGVPMFYMKLISSFEKINKIVAGIKYSFIGGSSWDGELLDKIYEKLGVKPYATYGLTETSPIITFSEMKYDRYTDRYSVGGPIDGVKIKTNTVNEILVKGPNVASYDSTLTKDKNSDWFNTGDIGEIVEGNLFIFGRNRDFINKSGVKINCSIVESKIKKIKGVVECVAAGVPSNKYSEDIGVAIMCDKNFTESDLDKLDGRYKPRHIVYIENLPIIKSSGKLDRKLIKKKLISR